MADGAEKPFGEPGAGALCPHNFYKLRLYLKINPKIMWSDHFSLHGSPAGCSFHRSPLPENPKRVSQRRLPSFYSIIYVSI